MPYTAAAPAPAPPPGGVYMTAEAYAELRRASERYAELLAKNLRPSSPASPVASARRGNPLTASGSGIPASHLGHFSLMELRQDITLRQTRPGTKPSQVRPAAQTFPAVLHLEQRRLLVFRQGGGCSRLVSQLPLADARGGTTRPRLHKSERAGELSCVMLGDAAAGRVVEIGFGDPAAAEAFYFAIRARVGALCPAAQRAAHSPRATLSATRPRSPVSPAPRMRRGPPPAPASPRRVTPGRGEWFGGCCATAPAHPRAQTSPERGRTMGSPPPAELGCHAASPWSAPPAPPPPAQQHQLPLGALPHLAEHRPPAAWASPPRRPQQQQGVPPHPQLPQQQQPLPPPPLPPEGGPGPQRPVTLSPSGAERLYPARRPSDAPAPAPAHSTLPGGGAPAPSSPHATEERRPLPPDTLREWARRGPQLGRYTQARPYYTTSPLAELTQLCDASGCYYSDPDFGPDAGADAAFSAAARSGAVLWRRLPEVITGTPLLPPDGVPRGAPTGDTVEIAPGAWGSWLLSVLAVALQELSAQGRAAQCDTHPVRDMGGARFLIRPRTAAPAGVYQVQVFDGLRWVYVIVDDRVPCDARSGACLLPTLPGHRGGQYLTLLLKAMAKLHGGWELLRPAGASLEPPGGRLAGCPGAAPAAVLASLTGGCPLLPSLLHRQVRAHGEDGAEVLWALLARLLAAGAEVLSIAAGAASPGSVSEHGLQTGGLYRLLETSSQVDAADEPLQLVRLHSPYCEAAWTGEWGPDAPEWQEQPQLAAVLAARTDLDGSFWMEFSDFVTHFSSSTAVRMFTGWNELSVRGQLAAMGGPGPPDGEQGDSLWYELQVQAPGPIFVTLEPTGCDAHVQLSFAVREAGSAVASGRAVLASAAPDPRLSAALPRPAPAWAATELPLGRYCIVPGAAAASGAPFASGGAASFALRVFAHQPFVLTEQRGPPA
eukprot:TRINITY_DN26006_c4_g1_i1.p1 TRINITY_DN26006_c4_g1~~TRINITY_DN26006_c4_g1_i1.p1  ORF type:complete len:943 (+),score=179.41 TRINITY_DN26006_c4_g1_i1:93-2921(+)